MKNLMTQTMKALAVAGMTMGLALGAQAETIKDVKYIDANGIEQTCAKATLVTASTSEITGWCVVTGTVKRGSIRVSGAAHLILADGCSLTATGASMESGSTAGITVQGVNNSLTVYGQTLGSGNLIANGGGAQGDGSEGNPGASAGIGGNENNSNAPITINGGVVTATGGTSDGSTDGKAGAGIGSGTSAAGSNITINGGTVTATGGKYGSNIGAGIGSGHLGNAASNIKVNPLMRLKAGASENPSTEIAKTRTRATDVATDLANKQYVTAKIDYNIALENGEAYRSYTDDSRKITERVSSMGLTYAGDNVWTMSNFVFRTNNAGLRLLDTNTTLVVIGTNVISTGNSDANENNGLYCIEDGSCSITIKGAEDGDNALTIDAPNTTNPGGGCSAINSSGALVVGDNVTINAFAGYGDCAPLTVMANSISVSGTGKLIAKADATVKNAKGLTAPIV